jgi:hypothetical protein
VTTMPRSFLVRARRSSAPARPRAFAQLSNACVRARALARASACALLHIEVLPTVGQPRPASTVIRPTAVPRLPVHSSSVGDPRRYAVHVDEDVRNWASQQSYPARPTIVLGLAVKGASLCERRAVTTSDSKMVSYKSLSRFEKAQRRFALQNPVSSKSEEKLLVFTVSCFAVKVVRSWCTWGKN